MTRVVELDYNELPINVDGSLSLDPDTIYVVVRPIDLSEFITKKKGVHHGPLRNRGKGKANRDWEK